MLCLVNGQNDASELRLGGHVHGKVGDSSLNLFCDADSMTCTYSATTHLSKWMSSYITSSVSES